MKIAAIDIGTNSIHMVIAEANSHYDFAVIDQEKEMVKLGSGVFATKVLNKSAFNKGLETLRRYVQLADSYGVSDIVAAATSAIREARNGGEFLDEVVQQTGIAPNVISGKEEARLIFLAVQNAIALADETVLVLDIGGGSTEAVLGNRTEILLSKSLRLGVLRLLDMFDTEGPVGKEARGVLEAHIRFVAEEWMRQARNRGFARVIGTSGTIRCLGEAAHIASGSQPMRSLNAEVVGLREIEPLSEQLLQLAQANRSDIKGISERRSDAIHLGSVLLVQLLKLADVSEITLCEASLREGLILDYLERFSTKLKSIPTYQDLKHRSVSQLAFKFNTDWNQKSHVARLALQLFDQIHKLHSCGSYERDILEYAALLYDIGQYLRFKQYHKHSRYILTQAGLRGFTDEEVTLIGLVVRYHRKATPRKEHKAFRRLPEDQQFKVRLLSGILRIAVALDRTKNQWVESVNCRITEQALQLALSTKENPELEIWAANKEKEILAEALQMKITISNEG